MAMPNKEGVNITEPERLFARMKSYIGPSILVFFLYLLFYFPGLIANYIYRKEARRMEKIAGKKLPGTGCLGFMFWLNILNIPLLLLAIIILLLYAIGKTIYMQFANLETIKEFAKTIALVSLVIIIVAGIRDAWGYTGSSWTPEGGMPLTIFSWGTKDEIIQMWRIDFFKSLAASVLSAVVLVLGVWKNGWIKALEITLKKISTNFLGALGDVWRFVNAEDREERTVHEGQSV